MWKEFREFIITGNVIEFAVAVILAGAVSAVVVGFVDDIFMPVLGYLVGGLDFSDMRIILEPAYTTADGTEMPETAIRYGAWISTIINLILVGFVLFLMVKAYNKTKKPPQEEAQPIGPTELDLLKEIRDALKK